MYLAELRKLSKYCDFKANLSDALRDRLVCGIKKENIQKRLLSESDLKLKKAIEIATAMETASKDGVELQHQLRPDSMHKLSKRQTFLLSQRRTIRQVFAVLGLIIHQISVTLRKRHVDFAPKRDTLRVLV